MSRRSSSPAALLAFLLAACGQSSTPPSRPPAATPAATPAARSAAAPATGRPGSFTVLARGKAALGAAASPDAALPRGTAAAPVRLNEPLGVPSLLWVRPGAAAGAPAAARAGGTARPRSPVEAARAHLSGAAAAYRLGARDAAAAEAVRVHDTGRGPIIVTFKQRPGGVEVLGESASVLMARDLSLVAIGGALSPADPAAAALGGGTWSLDARGALAAALTDLTGEAFAAADFAAAGQAGALPAYQLVPAVAAARAERLLRPATVERVWYRLPAGLQPAWRVEVAFQRLGAAERLVYGSVVSATDGALLQRKDQQVSAAYAYRVWASDLAPFLPDDGPQGLAGTPHPTGLPDGFQAPVAPRALVTLESLPFSRNDPWLPPGAGSTFGNNVVAYADLAAPDHFGAGDLMGATSAPGAFDWTWDPASAPGATPDQIQAAITQAFYVTNALHDWFYDAGYDEAAGNTQSDNYGRGGLAGDPLTVEVQDFNGLDNATTFAQRDGTSPWMEMYLWSNGDLIRALVNAPASVAGPHAAQPALFGPQAFDLTAEVARPFSSPDTVPTAPLACAALPAGSLAGKIALVDRASSPPSSVCAFTTKVKNAQNAGAVGVLVRNLEATQSFGGMGGTDATIVIPSLQLQKADGDAILAAVDAAAGGGEPVGVSLQRSAGTRRDGAVDSLLLAHEWAHVLSNRLVQDATGLFNETQSGALGEGWSDFVALLLAVRQDDAQALANAGWAGTYATAAWVSSGLDGLGAPNQGYYYGFRRTPYSTELSKAPLTFRHIADGQALPTTSPPLAPNGAENSEVHNAGEVWATALWECYAALLRDTQGATPRLGFDEANLRMREYLVASLKLLPQFPTFLEARDALLAVAKAGDPTLADFHAFWAAFAKRGMGVGAVAPNRFSATNAGVVESFAAGGQLAFVSSTFGAVTSGCDDQDGTLDNDETGTLSITLRNHGSDPLPAGVATITSSDPSVTFPDAGRVQLAPTPLDGTSVATARISLSGAGPAEAAELTVTFPPGYLAQAVPVIFPLRTNVDFVRAATATDDLESDGFAWTPGTLLASFAGDQFQRLTSSATRHLIFGPNPESPADITLTSPPLLVGAGAFTVAWEHTFGFEADPVGTPGRAFYDGGVVELSDDDGLSWRDVGGAAYNGQITLTGFENPLEGRPAFVAGNPSGSGTFDPVALDLTSACAGGSACAGKRVLLRFRIGSDRNTPGPGWLIDNVAFGGTVNTPFDLVTNDARRCINRPPTASAGADQIVDEGAAVTLDASGSTDLDAGTTLGFAWVQTSGPAVTLQGAGGARPTFTAPVLDADAVLAFKVTVSDGTYSSSATTLVTVRNVNHPPVADAGPAQAADERTTVTLDGTGSSDLDPGTVLGYAWTQVGTPAVTLLGATNARPSFVAPEVTADTTLTFRLVVSDGQASSAPAEVAVTIRNVNRPPVAVASPIQTVDEGDLVTVSAAGSSDPDGGPLSYLWTQTGEPRVLFSSDSEVSPTFTAPQVVGDTLLTFQLRVSDGAASATTTTSVLVRDVNTTPVADAGPAQAVAERTQVTLDGRASSDADPNTVLAYTWTQVGTPAVTLIGATSAQPAFTAPEVGAAGARLTFQLVVSDGRTSSAPSTATVDVTNVNLPPTATVGPDFSAPERASVFITVEGADPDAGTTLTYHWAEVGPQTVVLTGADTPTATFTAPEVTAPTDLAFDVTVSDGQASATSRITVTVTNVNRAPVASAGAPQTVTEGTAVHLDAAASADPDAGAVLTYTWTQTAGPPVTLTGANTVAPSFTAPAGDATLTFQVLVYDGELISTASVTVTVRSPGSSGGCGCSAYGSNPAGLVPFLLGLAFLRRRRARPARR
jgi:large repetitive protein